MPEPEKKRIQVKIPVSGVPRAYVDFDAEARQILGFPLVLHADARPDLVIDPITAARLIALELVSSKFFLHPDDCDPADAAEALAILTADRADVPALTSDRDLLGARASALLVDYGSVIAEHYQKIVDWVRVVPFYGFNMGPGGNPPHQEMWFDGAFVGSVVAPAARLLATTVDRVLWEVPLCLVGHTAVQYAASLGVKGIERPPDRAALKRIMAEAEARERAGELHPWQYADPVCFPLTDTQAQANPALIELFARIRAEYDRTGRPVTPESVAQSAAPLADGSESASQLSEFCTPLCVSAPLDGRDVRPTITVQDLSCCPSGARTESFLIYGE